MLSFPRARRLQQTRSTDFDKLAGPVHRAGGGIASNDADAQRKAQSDRYASRTPRQGTLFDLIMHSSAGAAHGQEPITHPLIGKQDARVLRDQHSPEQALAHKLRLPIWRLPSPEQHVTRANASALIGSSDATRTLALPASSLLNLIHLRAAELFAPQVASQNLPEIGVMEETALLALGIAVEAYAYSLVNNAREELHERPGSPGPIETVSSTAGNGAKIALEATTVPQCEAEVEQSFPLDDDSSTPNVVSASSPPTIVKSEPETLVMSPLSASHTRNPRLKAIKKRKRATGF
jgi:hypothetical protein